MRSFPRSIPPATAVALLCCACGLSVLAAEKNSAYQAAFDSIKTDDLQRHVGQLAGEALEGRESGRRGGLAAANYLAGQYARLKLRGAGDGGGFLQHFPPNFRNVLAIVEGSDPALRGRAIVVCAHYDHLGYGGPSSLGPHGVIYPGADDNASGTAAVLELAEAATFLARPPKRSIVFAHWDAEEKGLLGSKHWVANPTFPLDGVAAALNLDMIGRLRDERLTIFGSRSGQGWRRLLCLQNEDGLRLAFPWGIWPSADHYPFFDRGIPALMFHTGLHGDYHRPSDAAERIEGEGMARVARLLFATICELADNPSAPPGYRPAARYETPRMERGEAAKIVKPADRLGVGWRADAAAAGGVRASRIRAGSSAEKAGLRVGDLITRFAGRDIRADDDFFAAVAAAENPASMTVVRPGEEKPLELTAELDGAPLRWGITWRLDESEPGMVVLARVAPGSPAALAGLAAGDRIYRVDGRDFADENEFVRLVNAPRAALELLVERDGRMRSATLRPVETAPAKRAA